MGALHSNKVSSEKNAFLDELYSNIPALERLVDGDLSAKARRLHHAFLPLHIIKHYTPDQSTLSSAYLDVVMSHLIESECLLVLGFRTSGIGALRSAIESALKFLYYETHPIEHQLHQAGAHDLSGKEYREFAYAFPGLNSLSFMARDVFEPLWVRLCQFVHSDLKAISPMSVVADVSTILLAAEKDFQATLDLIKLVAKITLAFFLAVNPGWLQHVEKVYFDAVLEAYSVTERREVRDVLRIA